MECVVAVFVFAIDVDPELGLLQLDYFTTILLQSRRTSSSFSASYTTRRWALVLDFSRNKSNMHMIIQGETSKI
jgi:hypothetical protein